MGVSQSILMQDRLTDDTCNHTQHCLTRNIASHATLLHTQDCLTCNIARLKDTQDRSRETA